MAGRLWKIVKNDFKRMVKYYSAAAIFFAFDIFSFWFFNAYLGMNYMLATFIGFAIANSLNYFTNRLWGFRDTISTIRAGYVSYMGLATIALALISGFMFIFVSLMGIPSLMARIIAGMLVGIFNYIANHVFTFKIPFVVD